MKSNHNNLNTVLETNDSKVRNSIIDQMKNDDFSRDALDGILFSDLDSSDFKKLDKRFHQKFRNTSYFKWLTVVFVAFTFVGIIWYQKSEDKNSDNGSKKIASDKTSFRKNLQKHEKESLESNAQPKSQIEVKSSNFSLTLNKWNVQGTISNELLSNNSDVVGNNNQDFTTRLNTLETDFIPSSKQNLKGETGTEVLIAGLKTLDYRVYRKKTEKSDPLNITNGTTANFEGKNDGSSEHDFESRNYFDFLNETLKLFQKGQFSLALLNFQSILKTYDDDVNALFYGGLSLFNLKKYDLSITFFEKAMNNRFSNFREEIEWNLLLLYVETGNLDKASKMKSEIINNNGFYSKRASELNF